MIQESLIIGTLWYVLQNLWSALSRSALGRGFDALCRWVGQKWRESLIVNWFCSHRVLRMECAAPGRLRTWCCGVYRACKLDKLFADSIFLRSFFWCALAVVAAPFAPTMVVLTLALVGCASQLLRSLHEREMLFRNPVAAPVLIFAGIYAFGILTSADVRSSLPVGFITLAFLLYSLTLFHAVDTEKHFDLLLTLLVTVGAAVSCYGILQYRFGFGYQSAAWVDEEMFGSIGFRVGATMENPNMLGQYLTLIIPIGGAKMLTSERWRKLYYFACCAVMCVCMILTFSRGAWLGLLFAGALFFIAMDPRLLFLAPFALLALWFVLPETVITRFTSIGNLGDRSTSYRVSIWLGTINMLRDGHWLKGIGPGTAAFNSVYPFYSFDASVAQHSHSLYLQLICDAGIAELLAFLWLIVRYYRALGAALLRGGQEQATRLTQIAFASGALGFLVQAMTDYSFYNYRVMFLFWAYLALGMASARRETLTERGVFA